MQEASPAAGASAPAQRPDAKPFADSLDAAPAGASPQSAPSREKREAQPAPPAGARALSRMASDPMDELERIARLRAAGRDEEADTALEQFGRDHPGYRIPDAMQDRVKRR
jgi:hypothetical protein